jgi:hypothetical protein
MKERVTLWRTLIYRYLPSHLFHPPFASRYTKHIQIYKVCVEVACKEIV